jgi:hypothetical protein
MMSLWRTGVVLLTLVVGWPSVGPADEEEMLLQLTANTPPPARAFIDRRANCDHWFGEGAYDAE